MRDPVSKMMRDYRHRAKMSEYRFDLNYQEFRALITSNCFYCDRDPEPRVWTVHSHTKIYKLDYLANGIDRIDSNFGYTVQNCVACCSVCNAMKNSLTHEQFLEHLQKILTNFVK